MNRLINGLTLVIAVLAAAWLLPAHTLESPATPDTLLPVAVLHVQPQAAYERASRFVGRVEADRESEIGFIDGGRLELIGVDEGDRVETGAVLAQLDVARLKARRAELIAEHKAAVAQLDRARAKLKRRESMVDRGATSKEDVEQAREQFRTGEAAVELARARIDSVDVDLARAELRSPYRAIVTRRYVDEGRVVAAGEPIFKLQELAVPQARVGVAGPLVDVLVEGQRLELTRQGEPLAARIKAILPVRGPGTRTVDVILALEDTGEAALRAGDLVTLTLRQTVTESGYWLPLDALAEGVRGLWSAYLLMPGEQAQSGATTPDATYTVVPHTVDILHTTTERAYVRATLPHQALIVAGGVHRVVPGQQVRLAEPTALVFNQQGEPRGGR